MSQLTEPIFEIHDMEDMIDVINSDPDYLRVAKGPLTEINKADLATTLMSLEEGDSLVAEGTNSGMLTRDSQIPGNLEVQGQTVLSRTQRRDAHRRTSLRLDIPSFKSMETGVPVASRFAPSAPRAAPRISGVCYLTTDPELRTYAMEETLEEKVSEIIHDSNDAVQSPERFCLLIKMSDDIDKVLFKLKVNQEVLAKLMLKPLDVDTQIAIETRAAFGENLYGRIRVLIQPLADQRKLKDKLERERMVTFATIHKDMMKK